MSFDIYKTPIPASLSFLRNAARINPLIINYHVISDDFLPHIGHLYKYRTINTFRSDLDFICSEYTPISLLELLDCMSNKSQLPERAVMLTFDDGFREMYDIVAPMLSDRSISATFFLTKQAIDNQTLIHGNKKSLVIDHLIKQKRDAILQDIIRLLDKYGIRGHSLPVMISQISYSKRAVIDEIASILKIDFTRFLEENTPYLSTSQVKELLDNDFTIGGHSIDHANFKELQIEEQIDQALSSVSYLSKRFQLAYKAFAFPYSDLGITQQFFDAVSDSLDISFGTQGLLTDSVASNFQRLSVEKHTQSACRTIKFHYGRRIIYKLLSREVIQRT